MHHELENARRMVSEYAMALDLLAKLSHSDSERQAIDSIIDVFTILFSPKFIRFRPVVKRGSIEIDTLTSQQTFSGKFRWTEAEQGFQVKISYRELALGIVEVDKIAFPEYKEQYLNLALSISELCGLVIENAKKREQLKESEARLRQEKEKLEKALAEVHQLSGLLPICMHCKKIRDDQGYWNRIETYIEEHSGAEFSHGICEECLNNFYPE